MSWDIPDEIQRKQAEAVTRIFDSTGEVGAFPVSPDGTTPMFLYDMMAPLRKQPIIVQMFEPTEEEKAQRRAQGEKLRDERRAHVEAYMAHLHSLEKGTLRAVAELHQPIGEGLGHRCHGCDAYDDYADWPCSTANLIVGPQS